MTGETGVQGINFNVQYVKVAEVNKERQKELMMKSKFLSKMGLMKQLGDTNELCYKVHTWLEKQDSDFLLGARRSKSENVEKRVGEAASQRIGNS